VAAEELSPSDCADARSAADEDASSAVGVDDPTKDSLPRGEDAENVVATGTKASAFPSPLATEADVAATTSTAIAC